MGPNDQPWNKKTIIESHIINAVYMIYNQPPIPEASILLLAGAAWEMLDALSRRTTQPSTKGMLRSKVEDRFVGKFSSSLNAAYNAVKHAAAHPNEVIETDIEHWCGTVLYHACNDYLALFGEHHPAMMVHRMIWRSQNPLLMEPPTSPEWIFGTSIAMAMHGNPIELILWLERNTDVLEQFKRNDFPLREAIERNQTKKPNHSLKR